MLQVSSAFGDGNGHIKPLHALVELFDFRHSVPIEDENPIYRVIEDDEVRIFSGDSEDKHFSMPFIEYLNIILKSLKVFCSSRQIEFSGNSFVLQVVKAEAA